MRCIQLVSYLALCFWSSGVHASEEEYYKLYRDADISSCELRNLQQHWRLQSSYDTKLAIGQAIQAKKKLAEEIRNAAAGARKKGIKDCEFWDLDFTYEDAELMATVWEIDTYEAKLRIANKVAYSTQSDVRDMIQEAAKKVSNPKMAPSADPITAYFGNGYDYCHAKMIGKAYGVGIYETKVWLGQLLTRGEKEMVESKLSFAQGRVETANAGQNICDFHETRFNYADAEKLSKMWNISVSEAKLTLANKYLHGLERSVEEQLRRTK